MHGEVDAAAAVAVDRPRDLGATARAFRRREAHQNRRAVEAMVEPIRDRQHGVAHDFALDASEILTMPEHIVWIAVLVRLVAATVHRVGAGQHEAADQLLLRPATADHGLRQVIEQILVLRRVTQVTEIVDGACEPATEQVVPHAVHQHARWQRVVDAEHAFGEF